MTIICLVAFHYLGPTVCIARLVNTMDPNRDPIIVANIFPRISIEIYQKIKREMGGAPFFQFCISFFLFSLSVSRVTNGTRELLLCLIDAVRECAQVLLIGQRTFNHRFFSPAGYYGAVVFFLFCLVIFISFSFLFVASQ